MKTTIFPETMKYWVGVQRGQSYLMGRRCLFSLVLKRCDGFMIKTPYGADVLLHQPALHPIFPIGLVKTESDVIVRSVETGLGR